MLLVDRVSELLHFCSDYVTVRLVPAHGEKPSLGARKRLLAGCGKHLVDQTIDFAYLDEQEVFVKYRLVSCVVYQERAKSDAR